MMTNLIEDALTEYFGERCDEYSFECVCCVAWKQYDTLREMAQQTANAWAGVRPEEKQDGQ